jgi:hypothetical protein
MRAWNCPSPARFHLPLSASTHVACWLHWAAHWVHHRHGGTVATAPAGGTTRTAGLQVQLGLLPAALVARFPVAAAASVAPLLLAAAALLAATRHHLQQRHTGDGVPIVTLQQPRRQRHGARQVGRLPSHKVGGGKQTQCGGSMSVSRRMRSLKGRTMHFPTGHASSPGSLCLARSTSAQHPVNVTPSDQENTNGRW